MTGNAPTRPTGLVAGILTVFSAAGAAAAGVERALTGRDARTARGNAWAALQADRERARARDETALVVRALITAPARPRRRRALVSH